MVFEEAFKNSPLIVLNNFSGEGMQLKLIASMFQNMFPTINLTNVSSIYKKSKYTFDSLNLMQRLLYLQVDLSTIRRCVCLNYNTATKTIDFRHYAIKVVPVGLSKGVTKLVRAKIPNLSKCQDFSEFLTKSTVSESEAEDDPNSHVTLSQKLSSRGNHENSTSAIRLSELGPRITLQLMKVEGGLLDGEVLFHEFIHKTEEEKLLIQKKREEKKKLKEKRKKIQEENKKKKELRKEEHKQRSLKGMQKKKEIAKESMEENVVEEEDDDAQYYREEVGEEPEKGKYIVEIFP